MLPKTLRVKKKQDFQKIFSNGQTVRSSNIICKYLENDLSYSRSSFTISKKLKLGAVQRNRLRRQISASFQTLLSEYQSISQKFDFIFIISRLPKANEKRYTLLRQNISELLEKIKKQENLS